MKKGIKLDDNIILEAKREFLSKELEQALPFLRIPIAGYFLYRVAKVMNYKIKI